MSTADLAKMIKCDIADLLVHILMAEIECLVEDWQYWVLPQAAVSSEKISSFELSNWDILFAECIPLI